jgi:hypothetical protein
MSKALPYVFAALLTLVPTTVWAQQQQQAMLHILDRVVTAVETSQRDRERTTAATAAPEAQFAFQPYNMRLVNITDCPPGHKPLIGAQERGWSDSREAQNRCSGWGVCSHGGRWFCGCDANCTVLAHSDLPNCPAGLNSAHGAGWNSSTESRAIRAFCGAQGTCTYRGTWDKNTLCSCDPRCPMPNHVAQGGR